MTYTAQGHTKTETNSQSERTYGYNAAERLTNFTSTLAGQANAQIEANYRYDPFGRRISKAVKEGATTKATYFLYSDTGLMGEANEQGQLTKAYGFNPSRAQKGLWSTDPVWQAEASGGSLTAQSSSFHYLHTDHLGTPILATDKLGATTWTAVAEAFGATGVLQGSSIAMNLRFPGQYWDGETGNHYNFHRDYKAGMGRYLEGDPIGLDGGVNLFAYSLSGPVNKIDPDGLDCITLVDLTIPEPWWTEIGRSGRKYTGDWFLANMIIGIKISPYKKPWQLHKLLPSGTVKCFFKRPYVEEVYKERQGIRIRWGVCFDSCGNNSTWYQETREVLEKKTEIISDFENKTSFEPIKSATEILGLLACQKSR